MNLGITGLPPGERRDAAATSEYEAQATGQSTCRSMMVSANVAQDSSFWTSYTKGAIQVHGRSSTIMSGFAVNPSNNSVR